MQQTTFSTTPQHVAIIMDGNGRWAKLRGLPRLEGHRQGVKALHRLVEAVPDMGVRYLTCYTFSTENWSRPADEVSGLMHLMAISAAREIEGMMKNGVQLRLTGRIDELPESLQEVLQRGVQETSQNSRIILNLAINYGGRREILDAVARLRAQPPTEELTENSFAKYLYSPDIPDPDLLIRTGGELRISNFLLWQCAYSEIWVTERLWPDFTPSDFAEALADFASRERRFGKTSAQL
jgi:undecaprenyl diphosphate synthase